MKRKIGMEDVLPIAESLEDEARVLQELAHDVRRLGRPAPFKPKLVWTVTEPVTGLTISGKDIRMNIKNTEQVDLKVSPKNRKGGPARVENGVWEAVTDTGAFTIEPHASGDPLQATLKGNPNAPGDEGDVGIARFTGDSDLTGEGVMEIVGELAVNVLAADATVLDVEAGVPTEQL